jgi:adenylosuccinate lyase
VALSGAHRQRLGQSLCLAAMREVWSSESKIIAERRLWLAALVAQRDLEPISAAMIPRSSSRRTKKSSITSI